MNGNWICSLGDWNFFPKNSGSVQPVQKAQWATFTTKSITIRTHCCHFSLTSSTNQPTIWMNYRKTCFINLDFPVQFCHSWRILAHFTPLFLGRSIFLVAKDPTTEAEILVMPKSSKPGDWIIISQGFVGVNIKHIHPRNSTWNLEMMVSNRNLLFQGSIFRFHVCFGGCIELPPPRMPFVTCYVFFFE